MEAAITIFNQILIMFVLSAVGYALYKGKKISSEAAKGLGNILIFVSLPCVIFKGFLVEYSPDLLFQLFVSAAAALVLIVIAAVIARVASGGNPVSAFGGAFSNPGFFATPLVIELFGNKEIFFIAFFIAFLNLGQWTYGAMLLQKEKSSAGVGGILKRLIKAPFMIALILGLVVFFSGIQLPDLVTKSLNFLAGINTPIAMFTIGIYLAQADVAKMFANKKAYIVSAVRLILIPVVSVLLLCLLPREMYALKMTLLLAAAAPVGSNVAVYAQLYDGDYVYAVETVVISTLLSLITLPVFIGIAQTIWLG